MGNMYLIKGNHEKESELKTCYTEVLLFLLLQLNVFCKIPLKKTMKTKRAQNALYRSDVTLQFKSYFENC